MKLSNYLEQLIRDLMGMPTMISTYNIKLKPYKEIIECINNIMNNTIDYFETTNYYEWQSYIANVDKIKYQMLTGIISVDDYTSLLSASEFEKNKIMSDFIDNTDLYFVSVFINKLKDIKKRNKKDSFIQTMNFDSWEEMLFALELSKKIIIFIENSDDYADAKKIAEVRDKYLYERHIRKGR